MDEHAGELPERGFTWVQDRFGHSEHAFETAGRLIEEVAAARGMAPIGVVGDFVVPPVDGGRTREFQTLHFDFGLPLDPKSEHDLAHFTALHIPASVPKPTAVTRLVPLAALLTQRTWAPALELRERLAAYGRTHGAWDDSRGYVEGSLARLVEAAAAQVPFCRVSRLSRGFCAAWSSTA